MNNHKNLNFRTYRSGIYVDAVSSGQHFHQVHIAVFCGPMQRRLEKKTKVINKYSLTEIERNLVVDKCIIKFFKLFRKQTIDLKIKHPHKNILYDYIQM